MDSFQPKNKSRLGARKSSDSTLPVHGTSTSNGSSTWSRRSSKTDCQMIPMNMAQAVALPSTPVVLTLIQSGGDWTRTCDLRIVQHIHHRKSLMGKVGWLVKSRSACGPMSIVACLALSNPMHRMATAGHPIPQARQRGLLNNAIKFWQNVLTTGLRPLSLLSNERTCA